MTQRAPRLWVIAGPNGAGKSSIVAARIGARLPIINPDDIARDSTDGDPAAAGRLAVAGRRDLLRREASFGIETTLSGVGVLRFIASAKACGYRVMLIYVGVNAPELSRLRVIGRVADGGHDVPEADVFRRYITSMSNLAAALDLAERAWVVDNSGRGRRLLLHRDDSRVRFMSRHMTNWAMAAIPERLRSVD